MIKVLEHGVMKITCPNCKAKLQYEQEDIITEKRCIDSFVGEYEENQKFIICPDCNNEINLTPKRR